MGIGPHAKDLRTFLAEVKQRYPEELITVEREADLRFEISALLVKLDRAHKFPITQFTNLRDVDGKPCAFPLLSNLFASRRLCALALDSSVEKVGLDYDTRSQHLKTPLLVDRSEAPVKQVVRKNEQVNLFEFPVPLPYHMGSSCPLPLFAGSEYAVARTVMFFPGPRSLE